MLRRKNHRKLASGFAIFGTRPGRALRGVCLTLGLALAVSGCKTTSFIEDKKFQKGTHTGYKLGAATAIERGQRHYAEGRYGLAEHQFRNAVEHDPQNVDAWLGLAASYDRMRRFDLSERAYRAAHKLEPGNAAVLNNMGYSYLLQGKIKKARKRLRQAERLDPTNPSIRANLALMEKGVALAKHDG